MAYDEKKFLAIVSINTVDDIFSSDIIDPVVDYEELVTSSFLPDVAKRDYILEMINRGYSAVVSENIAALDINENWRIAEEVPEFMGILAQNFSQAFTRENSIYTENLEALGKVDSSLVTQNWEVIARNTNVNLWSRAELISILNGSEAGQNIVNQELPSLFYGNYPYNAFIDNALNKKLLSKEQIAGLILQDPTRMIDENLHSTDYTITAYDFVELLDKMDEIITTIPSLDVSEVAKVREDVEEFISQNFDSILEKIKINEDSEQEQNYSIKMLKQISKWNTENNKIGNKIAENYEEISSHIHDSETMDLQYLYTTLGGGTKAMDIADIMAHTFSYIKDPDMQWVITRLASELLEDQALTPDKMEIYGSGNYSRAIKIGDYIFKVGDGRSTPTIPYHPRIIQPLIRQEMMGANDENTYIEVQNLVEKDWYKGLSEEEIENELFKVYSEIRDSGLRWTDVRKENVGRLIKPNTDTYNINGQELHGIDSARGFKKPEGTTHSVLGAGELVIIDTDFIYEQDADYSYSNVSIHRKLEERYQREKEARAKVEEVQKPNLLTSAIELSRQEITHTDLTTIVSSIADRQVAQGLQKIPGQTTDDKNMR